jgi:diguanylate cyclase (GGDEF)-like protein
VLASAASRPAAILFDMDHFKRVNDTYGHDVGDLVLRDVSRVAASDSMTVGRLGGEEFAILLEETKLEAGLDLAEDLRAAMAALTFDTDRGKLALTCSFGVAEWEEGENIDQLLKRADAALYEAKAGGRNRVVAARGALTSPDPQASLFAQPLPAGRFTTVPHAPSGKPAPLPIELSGAEPQWLARTA